MCLDVTDVFHWFGLISEGFCGGLWGCFPALPSPLRIPAAKSPDGGNILAQILRMGKKITRESFGSPENGPAAPDLQP